MKNEKLISVVMGIYNCADTLEKAVQSIIGQTYTNWELIMCDDGSTDSTYDLALSLAKKDNRIKVLKNETNLTLAPTLNRCIDIAKGEYLARMDGDDICDKNRFQKEYDFLEKHLEYALVSCDMELFDDNGVYRVVNYREKPEINHLAKGSQFCHAGCMMRTDILRKIGCYNVEDEYNRIEDYCLWVKLYKNGYKGFNIKEVLYSMRDNRNAFKRRTLKNRINEARLQKYVCKTFKLPIKYYFSPLSTILKAFIPSVFYKFLHTIKN